MAENNATITGLSVAVSVFAVLLLLAVIVIILLLIDRRKKQEEILTLMMTSLTKPDSDVTSSTDNTPGSARCPARSLLPVLMRMHSGEKRSCSCLDLKQSEKTEAGGAPKRPKTGYPSSTVTPSTGGDRIHFNFAGDYAEIRDTGSQNLRRSSNNKPRSSPEPDVVVGSMKRLSSSGAARHGTSADDTTSQYSLLRYHRGDNTGGSNTSSVRVASNRSSTCDITGGNITNRDTTATKHEDSLLDVVGRPATESNAKRDSFDQLKRTKRLSGGSYKKTKFVKLEESDRDAAVCERDERHLSCISDDLTDVSEMSSLSMSSGDEGDDGFEVCVDESPGFEGDRMGGPRRIVISGDARVPEVVITMADDVKQRNDSEMSDDIANHDWVGFEQDDDLLI